jgi:hypothetical protein
MIRVLVSSTFVDLTDHRAAVRDSLRQAGFIDVAMEHLGARDERPQNECLRLIEEESDYFVGIYAYRYGHLPDGAEVSITEAEYHAAGEAELKRLIYLVDPKLPWIPEHIDGEEAAEKLAKLKGVLGASHIWMPFTSPDNLAKSVLADLGREVRSAQLKPIDPSSGTPGKATPWTEERLSRYRVRRFTELDRFLFVPNGRRTDVPPRCAPGAETGR